MNLVNYYFLNKINSQRTVSHDYLNDLYQYYLFGSQKLNYDINIDKEEFKGVVITIFDVLRLKLSEEDSKKVFDNYLKLLMADAIDGYNVDLKWFIDHVWYLSVGAQTDISSKKYRDCIPFMQQKLINKFDIIESTKEKISRKVYTKYMLKR